ncbi:MAG: metallophosphoesterase [Verrucomicrobiota bacterium]
MKTLIIPDIHNRIDWVNDFLQSVPHDNLVFLGDFFDRETEYAQTMRTAIWLKETLMRFPNATFLLGNHDMHYRFPHNDYLKCSGYTEEKQMIINSIITSDDWNRFQLYKIEQGWLISHAGVSDVVFRPPGRTLDLKWIEQKCNEAIISAALNEPHDAIEPDVSRGGKTREGGIIWLDWQLFKPLRNIHQIVGHTVGNDVRERKLEKNGQVISWNFCIDCACRYVGVLQDSQFQVIDTGIYDPVWFEQEQHMAQEEAS